MRGDIAHIDFAHAPVALIIASPLHAGMEWAGRVVKNAQPVWRRECFRTHRPKQHRARFAKEIRNMRHAGVVGHNSARVCDKIDKFACR
jgi:hypothetical protein